MLGGLDWLAATIPFSSRSLLISVLFWAGSVILFASYSVPPLAYLIAGLGSAVTFTEMAATRIPHLVSYGSFAALAVSLLLLSNTQAILPAASVSAVILAVAWLAGTGPLGGESLVTRHRKNQNKPAFMAGGDPALLAVVAGVLASIGFDHSGVGSLLTPTMSQPLALVTSTEQWMSAVVTSSATVGITGIVALLAMLIPQLRARTEENKLAIKLGPFACFAALITAIIAT